MTQTNLMNFFAVFRPGGNADESFDVYSTPPSEVSSPSESGLKSISSSSSTSSEVEIRHSLKAAKDFVAQGKYDRANKVYQHIISLHPKHPDVLTAYGQLLEEGYDDVVEVIFSYSFVGFIRASIVGFLGPGNLVCRSILPSFHPSILPSFHPFH